MRIYLDNIPVTWTEEQIQNPSFTLRRKDEEGQKAFSFTGDLVFYGVDYDYLYSQLKTSSTALTNQVVLKFEYDCCDTVKTWEFKILADSIKWCDNECKITAAAVEKSTEQEQIVCLRNKLITDNTPTPSFPNGFKSKQHPRFPYCNELRPDWKHHAIIILTILLGLAIAVLTPVLLVIGIIVTIINVIISVINTLPGVSISEIDFDNDPSTNVFQEMLNYFNLLMTLCVGCGRKHPSPLVRDYATNVCEQCGIAFSSSILNTPASDYYNLCWHNAPVHKGVPLSGTSAGVNFNDYWIEKNTPILNGTAFFDKLKTVFNAEWIVENNTLYFERKDYFTNTIPWLDLTILGAEEYEVCYNWARKPRYSYATFEYQKDAFNWVGSEANHRWSDTVEWNSPYNPQQKGENRPLIEFSPCRFRNDGIDDDVLTFYYNAPFIGNIIRNYESVIILGGHTCFTPMLLIWDGNDLSNAKVSPVTYGNIPNHPKAGPNQFYNYPMWFDEANPGNLYTNFWFIDDPRATSYTGIEYTATVEMTCDRINNMTLDGLIKTKEGIGKIDEIQMNFSTNEMTIRGTI